MTSLAAISVYWSVRACMRVGDGLPRFHGVISGRSNSVRRLSARVTGFCANILNAVNAILDYVTVIKLTYGFLIYVVLLVVQFHLRFDRNIDHARVINFES